MKRSWIFWPLLLAFLLAGAAACSDDDDSSETTDRKTLEAMEADIDLFIGTPECGELDCRALPFGAKPCGGPWSYKIFALSKDDSTTLAGMIDGYNEFNAELNEKYGWMSDCMYVSPPGLDCLDGVCRSVYPAKRSAQ